MSTARTPLLKADKLQIVNCMIKNIEDEADDTGAVELGRIVRKRLMDPLVKWYKKCPAGLDFGEYEIQTAADQGDDTKRTGELTLVTDKHDHRRSSVYYDIDLKDGPVLCYDYGGVVDITIKESGNEDLITRYKNVQAAQKKLDDRREKVRREMQQLLARYNSYETLLADFPDLVIYCGDVKKNTKTTTDRIKTIKKLIGH